MHVIRQLHAAELGVDLPSRKLLELLFRRCSCAQRRQGKKCKPRDVQPTLHQILPCVHRSHRGQLPALSRLLQHGLQGRSRSLISQFHVSSGEPDLVAASAWFTSRFETKLVLLDAPFAHALVAHGRNCERTVLLEHFAPMRLIR